MSDDDRAEPPTPRAAPPASIGRAIARMLLKAVGLVGAMFVVVLVCVGIALAVAYPNLPSLDSVEQIHAKALTLGFILLSGGIITGAAWAKSVTGFYFFEDARQLWSIIAWLIYALFLQARISAGWRGRRGILLSLLGFVVIVFTFLGVRHN